MRKFFTKNDLVIGEIFGDGFSTVVSSEVDGIPIDLLRYDGKKIHSIEKYSVFYIDKYGIKHIKKYEKSWQELACDSKAKLIKENNKWRPEKQEDIDSRIWDKVRIKRNDLLAKTDYVFYDDSPVGFEEKEKWKIYRKLLRDITTDFKNPESVIWPVAPNK